MLIAGICLAVAGGLIGSTPEPFRGPADPSARQSEPELLPHALDGWRHERLDFPLGFAPDIQLQGFEELRFAPGMFTPDSDSYFSYVLALHVEGNQHVDEPFVQDFLERYYIGLCGSVGRSRGLDLDLDAIVVTVSREEDGAFTCVIDMYDAFVTGEELTLHLDVTVTPWQNATRVLGLASPDENREAPVWEQLRWYAKKWQESLPLQVLLNHVYVVPDMETYQALAASEFLCAAPNADSRFAVWEARDTVREDSSYTGLYFYGETTYFEFLPPGSGSEPIEQGSTGIAFGVERSGDTELLQARYAEQEINTFPAPISRDLDGQSVPWFKILGISRATMESRLQLFSMEYEPAFLQQWHGDLAPLDGGIDRRAVLSRYAHKLGQDPGRALFQDLISIQLTLTPDEIAHLQRTAEACGHATKLSADGGVVHMPGLRLDVVAGTEPGGITGLEMSLREPHEPREIKFGKARLRLAGKVGALQF